MSRQRKIYNLVKEILTDFAPARDNDDMLVCEYYRCIGVDIEKPFRAIIMNRQLPTVESITRARRKVQEECPDLRCSEWATKKRQAQQLSMLEFARSKCS